MSEWRTDLENAPGNGDDFLIATPRYGIVMVYRATQSGALQDNCGDEYPDATHWMPLPEAPE